MNETRIEILPLVVQAWRRRWLALYTAIAVCLIGWAVVAALPNRYTVMTRIYVDTQSLLSPLMKGMTVNFDLDQQVQIMQRTLLSRPNLESVMRATDLDLRAESPTQREGIVVGLREATQVVSEGKNLFSVSYQSTDPQLAKRVVQSLLTIFVESNLGASRRDMEQARQFIEDQIRSYERKLTAAEDRLAEFKQRNLEFLRENGRYSSVVDQARQALAERREELNDARTRLAALKEQALDVPQFIGVETAPRVVIAGVAQPAKSEIDQRILMLQNQLSELKLRYTDRHPDVIITSKTLASLEEQRRAMPKEAGASPGAVSERISNPLYEQLKLKLIDAETAVDMLERREANQAKALVEIEAKAKLAPAIEAAFTALNRDYDVVRENYQKLLERRESARLSQEMDNRADKVIQFRVIEPPEVPMKPSGPNKVLLAAMVLALGLGGGGLVALALGYQAQSFVTPRHLREAFEMPVLGSVSSSLSGPASRHERVSTMMFAGALLCLLAVFGALIAHFSGTFGLLAGLLPLV